MTAEICLQSRKYSHFLKSVIVAHAMGNKHNSTYQNNFKTDVLKYFQSGT